MSLKSILAIPPTSSIGEAIKDAQNGIKRVEVNKIMVNFYETNTPFYTPIWGQLYQIGNVSIVRIEVPHKLGWIVMDGSIQIDKITKETRVQCRQDYPLTLSADRQISNAIIEAMALFPDTEQWFIPESIGKIPVKQLIIKRNPKTDIDVKNALAKEEGTKNLITMIDAMPSDLHITTQMLYDLPDMTFGSELTEKKPKVNFMFGVMCAAISSLLTILLFLYLKI